MPGGLWVSGSNKHAPEAASKDVYTCSLRKRWSDDNGEFAREMENCKESAGMGWPHQGARPELGMTLLQDGKRLLSECGSRRYRGRIPSGRAGSTSM